MLVFILLTAIVEKIRSIQWAEALPVRHQVLWPNKPSLFCKVEGDKDADHYGVYIKDQLVSVASIMLKKGIDFNPKRNKTDATPYHG